MGQRLNIEIHKDGQLLANCYYHWSGFTNDALHLTKQIVHACKRLPTLPVSFGDRERAVWLLVQTGAGMSEDGSSELMPMFQIAKSRNDGLISITPEGMEATRLWQEQEVVIDIANKTVNFAEALWRIERGDYDDESWFDLYGGAEVKHLEFDIFEIPFNKFSAFYSELFNKDILIPLDGLEYLAPVR